MTFNELFQAAKAVDPKATVSISVEAWAHRKYPEFKHETLEWTIWSDTLSKGFDGSTPEIALGLYRAAVEGNITTQEALNAIG